MQGFIYLANIIVTIETQDELKGTSLDRQKVKNLSKQLSSELEKELNQTWKLVEEADEEFIKLTETLTQFKEILLNSSWEDLDKFRLITKSFIDNDFELIEN